MIEISYPPPGKFNSRCSKLKFTVDTRYKQIRRVFFIHTERVPDFEAGESSLEDISGYTIRTSGPARPAVQPKKQNVCLDNATAPGADVGLDNATASGADVGLDNATVPGGRKPPQKKKRVRCFPFRGVQALLTLTPSLGLGDIPLSQGIAYAAAITMVGRHATYLWNHCIWPL
jgi:hypothetical protein